MMTRTPMKCPTLWTSLSTRIPRQSRAQIGIRARATMMSRTKMTTQTHLVFRLPPDYHFARAILELAHSVEDASSDAPPTDPHDAVPSVTHASSQPDQPAGAQPDDDPVPPLVEVDDFDSTIDSDLSDDDVANNVSSESMDCGIPDTWSAEDERYAAPPPPWSDTMAPSPNRRSLDYDVMAGAVRPSWLSNSLTHNQIASKARSASAEKPHPPSKAEDRSAEVVDYSSPADEFGSWPRMSTAPVATPAGHNAEPHQTSCGTR